MGLKKRKVVLSRFEQYKRSKEDNGTFRADESRHT